MIVAPFASIQQNQLDIFCGIMKHLETCGAKTLKESRSSLASIAFLDLWTTLSKYLNQEELDEFAYTANLIWDKHNESVYKQQFSHPTSLCLRAKYDLQLLQSIQSFEYALTDPQTNLQGGRDLLQTLTK